jgi:hypothetical protein
MKTNMPHMEPVKSRKVADDQALWDSRLDLSSHPSDGDTPLLPMESDIDKSTTMSEGDGFAATSDQGGLSDGER